MDPATFSANDAKTRFGEFIDRVQQGPVRVTRRDRVVGVMVSAEDYEAMRAFYASTRWRAWPSVPPSAG